MEYKILLNELKQYNPEMLDKRIILAISKCDMLDDELTADLLKTVKVKVPKVAISSVTGKGLQQLKDMLWAELGR